MTTPIKWAALSLIGVSTFSMSSIAAEIGVVSGQPPTFEKLAESLNYEATKTAKGWQVNSKPSKQNNRPQTFTVSVFPDTTVLTGRTVTVSLTPSDSARIMAMSDHSGAPLSFQWRRDGIDITNETEIALTLTNVNLDHAASYTMQITGTVDVETTPVHLSVFYHHSTNSNGGVMRTPVSAFSTHSTSTTYCPSPPTAGGTSGWMKWKTYMNFYGPNCPGQVGDFPNTSNENLLDFDTCSVTNGTGIDTLIRVRDHSTGLIEVGCNNDFNCMLTPANTKLSKVTNVNLQTGMTYRASIYLKGIGTQQHVTFNWNYHN